MKPNENLRLMFIALAIILIVAFTTLEISRIVEYGKNIRLVGLSSSEREFQRVIFVVLLDIITSPSVWLIVLFFWLAHKFKPKKVTE